MNKVDRDSLFKSSDLNRDLARRSVRGGMTTLGAQGIRYLLQIGSMVVLARLLTPTDYGLVGMVTVIIGFAEMFKDAGLSMATVQKEKITHEQVSSLFWINVMISVGIGLCVLVSSPLVARFYGKPELTAVTAWLSLSFILSGMTIQHRALLQRHMRFGTLASINITSQVVSIIVSIILAYIGWGYWALVGGTLTRALVGTLYTFSAIPWIPSRLQIGTGARGMLKFGGNLTAFNFINYFARNADNVLIGKYIGAEALGIYSKAYQLLLLPISLISLPLGSVAIPVMSRISKNRERLHRYYLHILYMLSLGAGPIAGISFLASNEIVIILLGPQWLPAGEVFKYFAIGGLLQPLYGTIGWLHIAAGRTDRLLKWGLIGTPIIVSSFVIGLNWGINGVAFCYSIAIVITTVAGLTYAGQGAGLSFWKMLRAVYRPLLSCVTAVVVVAVLSSFVEIRSNVASLITKGTVFVFLYGILLLLMYNGPKPVRDILALGQMVTKRSEETDI